MPLPKPKAKLSTTTPPPKASSKLKLTVKPPDLPPTDNPQKITPIGGPPPKPSTGILEVAVGVGAAVVAAAKPIAATTISANGYGFGVDVGTRTVATSGKLRLDPNQRRSRSVQTNAGKPDRQSTDHGGDYIAREFGGREIPANHFAQDGKMNRSQYRKLEHTWKKALKRKQEVEGEIIPKYEDNFQRPHSLVVIYKINGEKVRKTISNIKGKK